ncbi:hypothetical protein GCM10011533_18190 [Streptosporangium jomthongense]|nr:hypothetical protein GCM10011533_18190 [Streptosporangium jomthongense]
MVDQRNAGYRRIRGEKRVRLSIGFSLVLKIVLLKVVPVVIFKISEVVEQVEESALNDLYQSAMAETKRFAFLGTPWTQPNKKALRSHVRP